MGLTRIRRHTNPNHTWYIVKEYIYIYKYVYILYVIHIRTFINRYCTVYYNSPRGESRVAWGAPLALEGPALCEPRGPAPAGASGKLCQRLQEAQCPGAELVVGCWGFGLEKTWGLALWEYLFSMMLMIYSDDIDCYILSIIQCFKHFW